MDMRTPLGKVRGLGSAKEGTDHFWRQRLTAVSNLFLIGFFICFLVRYNGAPYDVVRAALSSPLVAVLMGLTVVSALFHMRLGMQVIIEDYVRSEGRKIALLVLNTFFAVVVGAACCFAVLKLSFGA